MARDKKAPMLFDLPDGDKAALITWEYVVDRLGIELADAISEVELINEHLKTIDAKLGDLIANPGSSSGGGNSDFDDIYVKNNDELVLRCVRT
jgi:hypothetical protein